MSAAAQSIISQELALRIASQEGDVGKVTQLIEIGVNVNAYGLDSKRTALHWASKYKRYEVVKLLLKAGADQSLLDKEGLTPLALAEKEKNNDDIISVLQNQFSLENSELKSKFEIRTNPPLAQINPNIIFPTINGLVKYFKKNISEFAEFVKKYNTEIGAILIDILSKPAEPIKKETNIQNSSLTQTILGLFWTTSPKPSETASNVNHEDSQKSHEQISDELIENFAVDTLINDHINIVQHNLELFNNPELLVDISTRLKIGKYKNKFENLQIKDNNIDNFTSTMAALIIEHVRFERKLHLRTNSILKKLDQTFSKNNQSLKNMKKLLKAFRRLSTNNLSHLKEKMRISFSDSLANPLAFFDFLEKYFSGNILEYFDHVNSIPITERSDPERYCTALIALSDKCRPIMIPRFIQYLKDVSNVIEKLMITKDEALMRFSLMQKEEEDEKFRHEFKNEIKGLVQDVITNNIEQFKMDFVCCSDILFDMYQHGEGLQTMTKQIFNHIDSLSAAHIKSTSQKIRTEFLSKLKIQCNQFEISFEDVRLKDKKFLKEKESERRAQTKEESAKQAVLMLQKKAMEQKQKIETQAKEEQLKKLLEKLHQKKDSKFLNQIADILNNTQTPILKTEFFSYLIKLEIDGFEKIQSNKNVPNNKLTVTMGKFYSFTLHILHAKDNMDYIDPQTIQHLKNMFVSIGMTKENFWDLIKRYSQNEVKRVLPSK